jgi:undecaprenyl-diphosphatase
LTRADLSRIDASLTSRIRNLLSGRIWRLALSILAHSGDTVVLLPLLGLLWWRDGFSLESVVVPLGIADLAVIVITSTLKYAIRRRRPRGEWGAVYRKTDPHSFPSGHAARTAAISMVVLALGMPLAASLLLAWSLAVGLSRVALGVHYVFDVVAGWLLGLAIGAAVWAGMGWWSAA